MTSYTNDLYLRQLAGYYPNKEISLVYNSAPCQLSSEVIRWIEDWNTKPNREYAFVIEFDDSCLTNIYQPPGIMYNKHFK